MRHKARGKIVYFRHAYIFVSQNLLTHLNLNPSHTLDSTKTRSLQIGLDCELTLVRSCEAAHNSSYVISTCQVAWNITPTICTCTPPKFSLQKPVSDAFKLLVQERSNITSKLTELDIEELMVEGRGKLYLLAYLDQIFTAEEKHERDALTHIVDPSKIIDYSWCNLISTGV